MGNTIRVLSWMPGGCQVRSEGKKSRVDVGSINLKDAQKKLAPADFQPKLLMESEDGFIMGGIVRGKTQEDIENFYTSKLGQPSGRFVMGDQIHLAYNDAYIVIYGKSGSIEIYIYKGKKAMEKIGR